MRAPVDLASLRVEYSTQAWKQIGRLSSDDFERMREDLDALARSLAVGLPHLEGLLRLQPELTFAIGINGHAALCCVDLHRRVLMLSELTERLR